jgi:hypothetical protein
LLDAGVRRVIFDAAGHVVEQRDSKGAVVLHGYDSLGRWIRLWAGDGDGEPLTLRERTVYGDALDRARAITANQLGRLYRTYDEAGLVEYSQYDFKGNALEVRRQVIADSQILQVFANAPARNWQVQPYRVQWDPGSAALDAYAATVLDQTVYVTSTTYDALNRAKTVVYPNDVNGKRLELHPSFNEAGSLERVVDSTGNTYVDRMAPQRQGAADADRVWQRCHDSLLLRSSNFPISPPPIGAIHLTGPTHLSSVWHATPGHRLRVRSDWQRGAAARSRAIERSASVAEHTILLILAFAQAFCRRRICNARAAVARHRACQCRLAVGGPSSTG